MIDVIRRNKSEILVGTAILALTMFLTFFGVFAVPTYGQDIGQWIVKQVKWIAIALSVVGMAMCIIKKQYAAMIGILLVGSIVVFFCSSTGSFDKISKAVMSIFSL